MHIKRGQIKTIIITLLCVLVSIVYIFPVYWLVSVSIEKTVDAFRFPPKILFTPTLEHYRALFETRPIARYYSNTLIVVSSTVLLSLLLGLPASYALARFRIKRKKDISIWILSLLMLPPAAAAIPYYLFMRQLGLLHTRLSLIIVYSTFNLPFIIWLTRSFFESLPKEIEEAALIDGCSRLGVLWRIAIPLSSHGIVCSALFCVILSWNEFLFAFILTGLRSYTLPVTIMSFWTDKHVYWGQILAIGTLLVAPIVILGVVIQKFLVTGFTFGAIKG